MKSKSGETVKILISPDTILYKDLIDHPNDIKSIINLRTDLNDWEYLTSETSPKGVSHTITFGLGRHVEPEKFQLKLEKLLTFLEKPHEEAAETIELSILHNITDNITTIVLKKNGEIIEREPYTGAFFEARKYYNYLEDIHFRVIKDSDTERRKKESFNDLENDIETQTKESK